MIFIAAGFLPRHHLHACGHQRPAGLAACPYRRSGKRRRRPRRSPCHAPSVYRNAGGRHAHASWPRWQAGGMQRPRDRSSWRSPQDRGRTRHAAGRRRAPAVAGAQRQHQRQRDIVNLVIISLDHRLRQAGADIGLRLAPGGFESRISHISFTHAVTRPAGTDLQTALARRLSAPFPWRCAAIRR
jgi:hypothetical protein